MEYLLNILLVLGAAGLCIFWVYRLANYDGKIPCRPEDCKTCPYGGGSGFCEYEREFMKEGKIHEHH